MDINSLVILDYGSACTIDYDMCTASGQIISHIKALCITKMKILSYKSMSAFTDIMIT
jgi:hypothetical protein